MGSEWVTQPTLVPPERRRTANRRRILIAVGITALFLAASIGVALYVANQEPEMTFLEVYLTDLPADVAELQVRLSSVTVSPHHTPLQLERPSFDLLAHRGPEQAFRVARGMVPVDSEAEIHFVFASAHAKIDHQLVALEIPNTVLSLGHDYGLSAKSSRSILFDINVDKSLTFDGPRAIFEPYVESVFIVSKGPVQREATSPAPSPSKEPAERVDFTTATSQPPKEQRLEEQPEEPGYGNPFTRTSPSYRPTPSPSYTPPPDDEDESDDNESDDVEDEFLPTTGNSSSVPVDYAATIAGWLVQFAPEADSPEDIERIVAEAQGELVYRFGSVPAAYVLGTPITFENLTQDPYVTYVEPVLPTGLLLSSSKAALRIPELLAPVTGIRDAAGNPIDGRGIGVAVVDTGIDGLHPDLTHRQITGIAAPLKFNYKVESVALVDMVYTDTTSGHGTHVAGIVAGRGTKDPGMKGVAPGATLYGFGIGELANTFWPNQAFDWIVQNGAAQDPPIRVVTNSWGTSGAYDPNSLTTRLVNQMVSQGIVVVFAAGNNGAIGGAAATTPECQIPTQGVICVAWYDDNDVGSRSGDVAAKSSRGAKSAPSTWPDVSAPGSAIRSARTPFGWVTGVGLTDYYVTLEGTSMAAPHVAGTAALMLQANPELSPAQVQAILQQTAAKYAPSTLEPYSSNGHYAKGHGLIDAYAAVSTAKAS